MHPEAAWFNRTNESRHATLLLPRHQKFFESATKPTVLAERTAKCTLAVATALSRVQRSSNRQTTGPDKSLDRGAN